MSNIDRNKIRATVLEQAKQDGAAYIIDLVISVYEAALAEIDKCEPVLKVHHGEICYKSQADNQSYGMWCPVNFDTEHTFKEGTEFYTSPQPIEWVYLSDIDKAECASHVSKLGVLGAVNATEAKLKQLNTKG